MIYFAPYPRLFQYPDGVREIKVNGRWRSRNTADALVAAACTGLGLVYLPIYNLRDRLDTSDLIRLLEPFMVADMATWLVYPTRQFLPASVSLLIAHLVEHFKE